MDSNSILVTNFNNKKPCGFLFFIKFDIKTPSNKNIIPNINSTMVIFSLNTFIIKSIILDNNTPSTKEYNLFSCFFRR